MHSVAQMKVYVCLFSFVIGLFFWASPAFAQGDASSFERLRQAETASARLVLWRGRLTEDKIKAQLSHMRAQGVPVLSWAAIAAVTIAHSKKAPLKDRSTGLVFDQSLERFSAVAWPALRRYRMPATVLIDPAQENPESARAVVRRLRQNGIAFGLRLPAGVTPEHAARRLAAFKSITGQSRPVLLMVGDGVISGKPLPLVLADIPRLTTDHGVIEPGTDAADLPAFVVSHLAATSPRFQAIIDALPLPVSDITPRQRLIGRGDVNPPAFGFTVAAGLDDRLGDLICRASGNVGARIERLGAYRIEVRLNRRFSPGLHRIDCLLPGRGTRDNVRWRWFGVRFRVEN